MTLEIPECEEHLADVPVANCQRSAHNLDTGSEIERIESNGVMKSSEQDGVAMELGASDQSAEVGPVSKGFEWNSSEFSPISNSREDKTSEQTNASDKGESSPLFQVQFSDATHDPIRNAPPDSVQEYDTEQPIISRTPNALRVPVVNQHVDAERKLVAPEIMGARRQPTEAIDPGHASRVISTVTKIKDYSSQAGRVLRENGEGASGVNPSPRSHRTSHRRVTPLGWFPRGQKTESYLERKIRMLQKEGGKIASLDETLGASNIHLSRIEREKQAAQAAAVAATEARKAALVEASWCRILKATGIPYMSAAVQLQTAEKKAEDALAAAAALGVILGHSPRSPRFVAVTDPSSGSLDNVSATLETAFDVDKAVASALKTALLRHTSELKDADLQKAMALITNPLAVETTVHREWVDDGPEPNSRETLEDAENSMDISLACPATNDCTIQENPLVESMLQRVRGLQPEECTSMATIVATRGLGALLAEEHLEQELGTKGSSGGSLGDVLVKHVSRLEAEKTAAKTAGDGGRNEMKKRLSVVVNPAPDFGSMLVKHVSRFEREKKAAIEAAAKQAESWIPGEAVKFYGPGVQVEEGGLDKIFVKKMSRLEREKAAAQERRRSSLNKFSPRKGRRISLTRRPGLGESLIKHKSRLEKEIEAAKARRLSMLGKTIKKTGATQSTSPKKTSNQAVGLGEVLIKHKSRLEREKEAAKLASQAVPSAVQIVNSQSECTGSVRSENSQDVLNVAQANLGDQGARKLSKLESEKQAFAAAGGSDPWARRRPSFKAREESADVWAGVGLGAALKRHVSKLEQEQAAWRCAEERARAH